VLICGLPLPAALVRAVSEGRWQMPTDRATLARVFGGTADDPRLYTFTGMVNETERWRAERDPEVLAQYLGTPSSEIPPGDVMQDRAVFIGDLGPDEPIALDYRHPDRPPSVIFLSPDAGWKEVAPDIEVFLYLLSILPDLPDLLI
jgi:hypothetical protein